MKILKDEVLESSQNMLPSQVDPPWQLVVIRGGVSWYKKWLFPGIPEI